MTNAHQRRERLGNVIGGVIRQAVEDAGCAGLLVLDATSPEGVLATAWAVAALPAGTVHPAPAAADDDEEMRRAKARLQAKQHDWLLAHPANRTTLLLARWTPVEPLLPLGDLFASQVQALAGGCTLPDDVRVLTEMAGGLDALDRSLHAWTVQQCTLDDALASLPELARQAVRERLRRKRAERRWPRRIPKLGPRTLWLDLFS